MDKAKDYRKGVEILRRYKTIAVVGLSGNPKKTGALCPPLP
jgi:predicted CoA-binding protein